MFYQEGASNVLADHLSRNPAFQPLPPSTAGASIELSLNDDWLKLFKDAYLADPTFPRCTNNVVSLRHKFPTIIYWQMVICFTTTQLCIPQRVLPDFLWHTHVSRCWSPWRPSLVSRYPHQISFSRYVQHGVKLCCILYRLFSH